MASLCPAVIDAREDRAPYGVEFSGARAFCASQLRLGPPDRLVGSEFGDKFGGRASERALETAFVCWRERSVAMDFGHWVSHRGFVSHRSSERGSTLGVDFDFVGGGALLFGQACAKCRSFDFELAKSHLDRLSRHGVRSFFIVCAQQSVRRPGAQMTPAMGICPHHPLRWRERMAGRRRFRGALGVHRTVLAALQRCGPPGSCRAEDADAPAWEQIESAVGEGAAHFGVRPTERARGSLTCADRARREAA